jgi:hypothetical protein
LHDLSARFLAVRLDLQFLDDPSSGQAMRLVEEATGAPPDPQPLVAALRRKYGELYGVR